MLNITPEDFVALLNGVYARVKADNVPTPQCFDVAQLWARVIGSQPFTGATADLIYNQPGDLYTQVKNSTSNFPKKGDLVIWKWPHVGMATGNNTDQNSFEVAEQNDPTASEIHIKQYPNYSGVIGWLSPKVLPTGGNSLPTNYDDLVHGSTQWDSTIDKYMPGQDPKHTDFPSLQTVIAGIQSTATASNNKVAQDAIDLAGANQQITNLEEKLAIETQQRQDDDKSYQAQIDALKPNATANQKVLATLQGQVTALQGQLKQALDDKHKLAIEIAQLQAGKTSVWNDLVSLLRKIFP